MEDIIKTLNIKEIYFLDMIYKDKHDILRTIKLDQFTNDTLKIVEDKEK